MAVKSVVDVELNDEAFKDFAKLFEKYREALGQTPGQWASAEKATAGTALNVENLVAALLTHEALNKKIAREEAEKTRQLERQQRIMRGFAPTFKEVAVSVKNIVTSLAKWASYGGVATGLLGFGGLLGLDRLANLTGAGRRNAQGLGTTYGEGKAFENSYDRLVDARGFLGGVNEALTDVTKRVSLFGAGLSNGDIAGKDTAQVANELIPALKRIADRTPDDQLAQVLQARGLGQFVTVEDLRRLKATSPEELRQIRGDYATRAKQFNVEDQIARKWQNLGIGLDAAKIKIEGVLVSGLEKLAGPLTNLSDHVANALAAFIKGLDQKTLADIGQGIEDFGKYLGSPQFRQDVKDFATDVSYAAKKIAGALRWLGLIPDNSPQAVADREADAAANKRGSDYLKSHPNDWTLSGYNAAKYGEHNENSPANRWLHRQADAARDWLGDKVIGYDKKLLGEDARWSPRTSDTNPGNIRMPGSDQGFAHFRDTASGVRAIARQLQLYGKRDHLDTVAKIIAKYAPAKDHNNVDAYVKDVVKTTGFGANEKLDLNDKGVLAKLTSAITKHEGRKYVSTDEVTNYINSSSTQVAKPANQGKAPPPAPAAKPARQAPVTITINNNTGGSAVVQSSQAAKQG